MSEQPSAAFRFNCPACGGRMKVPPGQAGQKCFCPRCNAEVLAPACPGSDTVELAASSPASTASTAEPGSAVRPPSEASSVPTPSPAPEPRNVVAELSSPPVASSREPSPGSGVEPARTAPPPAAEFGFECGLCRTRLYARPEQIGQEVACPDCHSKTIVKSPKAPLKPPVLVDEDGDELRLSEPVDRLTTGYELPPDLRDKAGSTVLVGAPVPAAPMPTGGRIDVVAEQARLTLAKAQAEADEIERAKPKLPERPFFTGLASFLLETDAAMRWLMLTLLLHATATLLAWIVKLSSGPGIGQVVALLMTMAAAVFGLVFTATAAASCLAILQDTSNGSDKIENWPGLQFTDWMSDVFYIVNALLAAALPGLFLGGTWMCLGGKIWSAFCGGALSAIALFPLFLTSMVAEGSCFSVASPAVWRSLQAESRWWGKFYLLSAPLGIGLLVLSGILVADCGFLVRGLVSALAVAAGMIYFRLLGRLVWITNESNNSG